MTSAAHVTAASCQAPAPITRTATLATPRPTATPAATCNARLPRWPTVAPSAMIAVSGANAGRLSDSTHRASSHAMTAAAVVCATGETASTSRCTRSRSDDCARRP